MEHISHKPGTVVAREKRQFNKTGELWSGRMTPLYQSAGALCVCVAQHEGHVLKILSHFRLIVTIILEAVYSNTRIFKLKTPLHHFDGRIQMESISHVDLPTQKRLPNLVRIGMVLLLKTFL